VGRGTRRGGRPADVRDELTGDTEEIEQTLRRLERDGGPPEVRSALRSFQRVDVALQQVLERASRGRQDAASQASDTAARQAWIVDQALARAGERYRERSHAAANEARNGTALVIVLLLSGFGWSLWRTQRARLLAEQSATAQRQLAAENGKNALTDPLTGLANRRALLRDLDGIVAGDGGLTALVLFDLDGFKLYNDTFGHPAGDALLARLGGRLDAATASRGVAYRLGGDEFCLLARVTDEADALALAGTAQVALTESGPGFTIGSSYGAALLPREAASVTEALTLVDTRLYLQKGNGRVPASQQAADVLVTVLHERDAELGRHIETVASLAGRVATACELPPAEVKRIRLAAEVHDIGKAAIPDAILAKTEPLDDVERDFLRRHPLIAERVAMAAPALAPTAELVRGHQERYDGTGYPDGLTADQIPIGARIIAACHAFDLLAHDHHDPGRSAEEALAHLRREAGTSFDPGVVELLADVVDRRPVPVTASPGGPSDS
jgi:diguanylate cyclase (GGDEF)-like protein